jgi:hypothetical protein
VLKDDQLDWKNQILEKRKKKTHQKKKGKEKERIRTRKAPSLWPKKWRILAKIPGAKSRIFTVSGFVVLSKTSRMKTKTQALLEWLLRDMV